MLYSWIIFFSFVLSTVGICLSVWSISLSFHLKQDWAERIEEVDAKGKELDFKIDQMRSSIEKVHKLHVERLDDIEPLLARLSVLETKLMAVSANQKQRQY